LRALEADAVGALHEFLEGLHGSSHLGIVERADVEVEILERLGGHFGHLGHGGAGPAQDDPAGFLDADFLVDALPNGGFVEFCLSAGTSESSETLGLPRAPM